ncbi:hypothetical protein h2es_0608 [Rickettsiales endosymbiont of Trichoplax sp. H2]|nr:hypothetical protein [Rickettsiales endosymbiont of Trichoplax sp. H2]
MLAAIPVKTNIPAPTITPIPNDTICNKDKLFFNLLFCNTFKFICLTDFFLKRLLKLFFKIAFLFSIK